MTDTTIHPLHLAILDSYEELCARPDPEQADLTATLSRILSGAFISSQCGPEIARFLSDPGVRISRLNCADNMMTDIPPGADMPMSYIMAHFLATPIEAKQFVSGDFALCDPFASLDDLLSDETLSRGGLLAFLDPIYEDGLVAVSLDPQSLDRWRAEIGQLTAA